MNYLKKEVLVLENVEIVNVLSEIGLEKTKEEILFGLQRDNKYIASKFFYNDKGSALFEEITQLKEYYPTRTEIDILKSIAPMLMKDLRETAIVELGSGDCSKIRILLDEISEANRSTINYIPVDVSVTAIENSVDELIAHYPELNIHGFVADFSNQLHVLPVKNKKLICFFGSTIGNLEAEQAKQMIQNISAIMNKGDKLLLGMDFVKSVDVLYAAYNDGLGVTAKFNKNILLSVNEIIQSNFNPAQFDHRAFFNKEKSRVEMHLIALCDMEIQVLKKNVIIQLKKGESIHTENSYKYTNAHISKLAEFSGLALNKVHSDKKEWFGLVEFIK
jgi:L-histidine N-alpha-methyltransferase